MLLTLFKQLCVKITYVPWLTRRQHLLWAAQPPLWLAWAESPVQLFCLLSGSQSPEAVHSAATPHKQHCFSTISRNVQQHCLRVFTQILLCQPERCAPVIRPHAPAPLLCSQHPPAELPHLTHCPSRPGSGPAASRSLLASESNTQRYTLLVHHRNKLSLTKYHRTWFCFNKKKHVIYENETWGFKAKFNILMAENKMSLCHLS